MKSLHVVCRDAAGVSFDKTSKLFTSEAWLMSENTARELVGAKFYLHQRQVKRSYHGGIVVDVAYNTLTGRAAVIYAASNEARGVTCDSGWAQEMAIIR